MNCCCHQINYNLDVFLNLVLKDALLEVLDAELYSSIYKGRASLWKESYEGSTLGLIGIFKTRIIA